MLVKLVKPLLKLLFGDYQYWKVYATTLPQGRWELPAGITIQEARLENVEELSTVDIDWDSYLGPGAIGFMLLVDGELAAILGAWSPERYEEERARRSWRIPRNAVKTQGLICLPKFRGNGYAVMLKLAAHRLLFERGVEKVYCRIWHNHRDSIRVSKKAGMRLVGLYIEICPFGKRIEVRIPMSII